MRREVLRLLQCPECGSDLAVASVDRTDGSGEIEVGMVACSRGHRAEIDAGVLVFTHEDAPSDPWSQSYATFEKYLQHQRHFVQNTPAEAISIIDGLPDQQASPLLDVCTGGGTLLFGLLNRRNRIAMTISVDMSAHVQRFNRRYMLEEYEHHNVTFIAADAARLPIKPAAIPAVVSYELGNMLDKFPSGLREIARVLSPQGIFVFNHFFVSADSKGWELNSEAMQQMGASNFGYLGLEQDFNRLMEAVDFSNYEVIVTGEIVGDADRDVEAGPIFPYPNEMLTNVLVRATGRAKG